MKVFALLKSVFVKVLTEVFGLFNLLGGLPKKEDEPAHLEAMESAHAGKGARIELMKHLYGCLSSIDSKAAALFTANSILTAVFAIYVTDEGFRKGFDPLFLGLMLLLGSTLVLTMSVKVYWSSTKQLKLEDGKEKRHISALLSVRKDRTIAYRLALLFTFLSIVLLSWFVISLYLSAQGV